MKKFILFYNPLSGNARFKYKLDDFIKAMHKYNCIIIPIRATCKEDTNIIELLVRQIEIEGILIAGGDGTLHEAVGFLYKKGIRLPIGIIPAGTSNDFANFLGINDDVNTWASMFNAGKTRLLDIGRANERYFLNTASIGLLANIAHEADANLKNTLGKMAYYLKGFGEIPNFRAIPMTITVDNIVIEDEVFLFVAANSRTVGGFANAAPNASVDDGKLDVLIIKKCSMPELIRLFIALPTGGHVRSKYVTYMQAAQITLQSSQPIESDLDGELGPVLPLDIEVIHQAVLVYEL